MKDLNHISGIITFLIGLGICLKSLNYPVGSFRLPGAGLFPLLASVILMALSGFMVIHSFLKKDKVEISEAPFFPGKETPKRILFTFVSLLAFRYLIPLIGFAPSTFLFIFVLAKILAYYSWKVSFFFSAVTALAAYYLFQVLLMLQMPKGAFGI